MWQCNYHHNVGVAGGGRSSWNQLTFAYTNIFQILLPESSSISEANLFDDCHTITGQTTDVAGSSRHTFEASVRHLFWYTIRINVISKRWVVDPFHPKRRVLPIMPILAT